MAKSKTPIPNLSNATPEFLTDELGDLRKQIKGLEKQKDLITEALKGRARILEQTSFVGERYTADLVQLSRSGLDTTAIREEMGEDWCAERTKTTDYEQLNVKEIIKD